MAEFKLGRIKFVYQGAWSNGVSYVTDEVFAEFKRGVGLLTEIANGIIDKDTKEKIYLDGSILTFDDRNYHGVDIPTHATWSIRIDGYFTDDFLERTGLTNHYK